MKNCLLILLLFTCILSANAQDPYLDSLKGVLSFTKEDTTRVLLLSEISLWSIFSNPDTSSLLAREGIRLAQQINYPKGEAYCKRSLGFFFWSIGDYTSAIKLAFSGMPYAEASKDFGLQSWLYAILENSYRDNGDYSEALQYNLKDRTLSQKLHQPIYAKVDAGTAFIYSSMNKLDSAQYYIRLSQQKGGMEDGWTCMVMGGIQAKLNQDDSAFYYYKLSIQKFLPENNFKDLTNGYQNIAVLYRSNGRTDSAIYYAQKGLTLAQHKSFAKEQFNLCSLLADAYEKRNIDSAFRYYKLAMVAKDSLFNREKAKQILSFQFDEELRQREIKRAETEYRNKVRTFGFIAGLIIFCAIALILWRSNFHKQKANALLQQQKEKVESTLAELRSTQAQLIQSEKMASLGELTAGIAHEIQNPLNFVNNFSEVNKELLTEMKDEMDKGNLDDAKAIANDVMDNEEKINHHGKRADAIVKGMLQHSRVSTGQKEPTDINALCDEYLRLSYHGMRAKDKSFNATLQTDFDASIQKINVAPQDIGRVLLNLFNNAFYACTERGRSAVMQKNASTGLSAEQAGSAGQQYEPTVSVCTKKVDGKVEIHVKDNGNGIPQKIVDKIFQPFFTTKPTGQGTGLGLSLSYDIIKAHGGEIKVETKEGEGSEFIIRLPV